MAKIELLVRRLLVLQDPVVYAEEMRLATRTSQACRMHIAPDTEILRIPVAKYESALDLACCLEKMPEAINEHDRTLCRTFLERRIRQPGYPKIIDGKRLTVFSQHFAPGEKLEKEQIEASDLLNCCHAQALPFWARTKHVLPESRGAIIGLLTPTELRGHPASLHTYIGLCKF